MSAVRVNYKCCYCGTALSSFTLAPLEPYVVKCQKCKRDLAIIAPERVIPILPKEVYPKEERDDGGG